MSIFFTTFVSLSFVLNFDVSENDDQYYFIFEGNDTFAYLYRENQTINLLLMFNKSYNLYQSNVTNSFIFEWDGFIVNDEKMKPVVINQLVFDVNQLMFANYTFLSSCLLLQDVKPLTNDTKELFQEFITAVVFDIILIGVVFRSDILRSDSLIRKVYHIFKILFNKKSKVEESKVEESNEEAEYVSIQ